MSLCCSAKTHLQYLNGILGQHKELKLRQIVHLQKDIAYGKIIKLKHLLLLFQNKDLMSYMKEILSFVAINLSKTTVSIIQVQVFTTQCSWEIQLSYIHMYVCTYTFAMATGGIRQGQWKGQERVLGATTGTRRHLWDNVEIQCSGNCLQSTRVTLVNTLKNGGHSI